MTNPNLQDVINRLSPPPLSQVHQQQQPSHGNTTMVASTSTAVEQQKRRWISSITLIGQDQAFYQVCNFLRDGEAVGMVGIYGMGGIGKTTIMKRILKEFLEPLNFKVIWIVISKSIDVDDIQKAVMEKMNLCFKQDEKRYQRAEEINKAFDKEKVALLFDDIWEFLNLEEIGIDISLCNIIFTTRSKKVCSQMQPDLIIKIECLGWNDSWVLFERSVGKETLESNPRITCLAKEVAKKCAGLPLALTIIGRAMTCKYTPEEWRHALNYLNALEKSPSELLDAEEKIFALLKLSYDALPDRGEKDFFLSCCLYPETEKFILSELVKFWIADGLSALNGSYVVAIDRGYDIFGTLLTACLLERPSEDDDEIVKMHNIVREMGLWIASKSKTKFFVHGGSHLTQAQIASGWREAHRIYVSKEDKFLEQPLCLNLTTLIVNNRTSRIKISNCFFKSMCKLRVLELHGVKFTDLPEAIGQLVELRYLGIHGTDLKRLPTEIGNLIKLEVLHMFGNRFNLELPDTIGQLLELRSLRVIHCLKAFPVELQNLSKLEILSLEFRGRHFEELPVSDQGDFINGLRRLSHSLRHLSMNDWPITRWDEVLSTLENMEKLSLLNIGGSLLMESLVFTRWYFSSLEDLTLTLCLKLEKIQIGQMNLQNLRKLEIRLCTSLKYMIGLQHLQGLVELKISESHELEELIEADEEVKQGCTCFPNLKVLALLDLAKLKCICRDEILFPSLTHFVFKKCPKLEKLPRGLMIENMILKEDKNVCSHVMNEQRC